MFIQILLTLAGIACAFWLGVYFTRKRKPEPVRPPAPVLLIRRRPPLTSEMLHAIFKGWHFEDDRWKAIEDILLEEMERAVSDAMATDSAKEHGELAHYAGGAAWLRQAHERLVRLMYQSKED